MDLHLFKNRASERFVFYSPLTPEGKEATKFSEAESLKNIKPITPESGIPEMMKEADRILTEMSDQEFCDKYGNDIKKATPLPTYNEKSGDITIADGPDIIREAKIVMMQELDKRIKTSAKGDFKEKLKELEDRSKIHVVDVGTEKGVLSQAQEFFNSANDLFSDEPKRQELFKEVLEQFGLDNEHLTKKGTLAKELKLKQDQLEKNKAVLEKAKLRIQELQLQHERVRQGVLGYRQFTKKLLKVLVPLGIAAVATTGLPVLPIAAGLGIFGITPFLAKIGVIGAYKVRTFPERLPHWIGWGVEKASEEFADDWHIAEKSRAEYQVELSQADVKALQAEMKVLRDKELLYQKPIQARLIEMRARRDKTNEEIKQENERYRGDTSRGTNKLESFMKRKAKEEEGIEHLERVLAVFDMAEKHKDELVRRETDGTAKLDTDSLDRIMAREYFPGTRKAVEAYLKAEAGSLTKSQEAIGTMNPVEINEAIARLTQKQREALGTFVSGLGDAPKTASEKAALLKETFEDSSKALFALDKKEKALYDLCVRLTELPKTNPFRAEAEKVIGEHIAEAKAAIENGTNGLKKICLERVDSSNFSTHFNKRFIHEEGLFKKRGLLHVADKVLGPNHRLKEVLDTDEVKKIEIENCMNATSEPHFTEQHFLDLKKVLESIVSDPSNPTSLPEYLVNEDGTAEKYSEARERLITDIKTTYAHLPENVKKTLKSEPWQLQDMVNALEGPGNNLSLPATPASDFMGNLATLDVVSLRFIEKALRVTEGGGMKLSEGKVRAACDIEIDRARNLFDFLKTKSSLRVYKNIVPILLHNPKEAFVNLRKKLGITRTFTNEGDIPDTKNYTDFDSFLADYRKNDKTSEDFSLIAEMLEAIRDKKVIAHPFAEKSGTPGEYDVKIDPKEYVLDSVTDLVENAKNDLEEIFDPLNVTKWNEIGSIEGGSTIADIKGGLGMDKLEYDKSSGKVSYNGNSLDHENNRSLLPYLRFNLHYLKTAMKKDELRYHESDKKFTKSGSVSGEFFDLKTQKKIAL